MKFKFFILKLYYFKANTVALERLTYTRTEMQGGGIHRSYSAAVFSSCVVFSLLFLHVVTTLNTAYRLEDSTRGQSVFKGSMWENYRPGRVW